MATADVVNHRLHRLFLRTAFINILSIAFDNG
jgi:hypothetical protein